MHDTLDIAIIGAGMSKPPGIAGKCWAAERTWNSSAGGYCGVWGRGT
jgi:hypothetical protein